jgi:hypothetical protein
MRSRRHVFVAMLCHTPWLKFTSDIPQQAIALNLERDFASVVQVTQVRIDSGVEKEEPLDLAQLKAKVLADGDHDIAGFGRLLGEVIYDKSQGFLNSLAVQLDEFTDIAP